MDKLLVVDGRNPLKVSSAIEPTSIWLPEYMVDGSDKRTERVPQPIGWAQLTQCVEARAHDAMTSRPEATIGLGIESGVMVWGNKLLTLAAVYLEDHDGRNGSALTCGVQLPGAVARIVAGGSEVGNAVAALYGPEFGRDCVGAVTNGRLQAVRFFSEAVDLAMQAYVRPQS